MRDANGRFIPREPQAVEPSSDLLTGLRSLFVVAQKTGDFSGAATLARVVSQLEQATPDDAVQLPADYVSMHQWLPEERAEVMVHIAAVREIKARVLARHKVNPVPWPSDIDEATSRANTLHMLQQRLRG